MEVDSSPDKLNPRKRKCEDDLDQNEYRPQIGIVYDRDLFRVSSKVPQLADRASMVHSLIEAYDLLRNMTLYKSRPATDSDLNSFHSSDFIEYMKSINSLYTVDDDIDLDYGLGYDCPPLDGIYDYICAIVGSSLTAARALCRREVDIAINWCGGWHHAHRELVEGFCYANDIVVAILELRQTFDQILYIDLDAHHGNGVEDCFAYTKKVFTLSLHKFESGYYPGTGALSEVGFGRGRYYTVNIPLKEGITDSRYCSLFKRILEIVTRGFSADAVVVQCGADSMAGDPLGGLNLTPVCLGRCLTAILALHKPTLILGGGGYNAANTARCWTYLTSVVIGCDLDPDIPEHQYFTKYGPGFELLISQNNRKDMNEESELENIIQTVKENVDKMIAAHHLNESSAILRNLIQT